MTINLTRNIFIGMGEVGIKAIISARNQFGDAFESIPPILGFIGMGIEENPPVGLSLGEYFRIRPASDRSQFRSIFMEESAMAFEPILHATMDRISSASFSDGPGWSLMDGQVRIHLVFSLSDLVGAGLCIDVAFMIRALFGDSTVVFMHSVYSGLSEPIGKRHAANAYATLLDLDYLMSTISSDHPYEFILPYDSFQIGQSPLDSFFLVGAGNNAYDDLGAALYASTLEVLTSDLENIRQCMFDGSMDVEDKKAWITHMRSSSFSFPLGAGLEQKEAILREAVNALSFPTAVEEKGYNNAPYLIRHLFVAGPEDELIVLQQEPRLNSILSSDQRVIITCVEKPLKKIVLTRIDGAYPAFQLAGWDHELAYKSYEDIRPFHFDLPILERMLCYRFSLDPLASIPADSLALWVKGRLLGLIPAERSLPRTSQELSRLLAEVDRTETEEPEKAQATYEKFRHLPSEKLQDVFPCPEELVDAVCYYCSREL